MTAPKPIVTPGPSPQGPPGWEEKQQDLLSSGQLTNEKQSSNYHDDLVTHQHTDTGFQTVTHGEPTTQQQGGLAKLKEKVHHIGEKLALVPPTEKDEHGNALERSAHRQDGSTMPE